MVGLNTSVPFAPVALTGRPRPLGSAYAMSPASRWKAGFCWATTPSLASAWALTPWSPKAVKVKGSVFQRPRWGAVRTVERAPTVVAGS